MESAKIRKPRVKKVIIEETKTEEVKGTPVNPENA